MQITIKPNACILSISADSIHAKSIEHFINKNFKRVLAFTNTRLVFPNKSESIKRNYFLNWAYQVYCKSNTPSSILEEQIKTSQNIPIKVILTSTKNVAKKIVMSVSLIEGNRVVLQTGEKDKQLCMYLQIRFAKAYVETLPQNDGIIIKVMDKETLTKLKNLLSSSLLMGMPISFKFPNGRIDNISLENSETSLVKNAFNVLGVDPTASMNEIKVHYRKLLRKYHPDRVYMCDEQTISIYTAKFQSIQNAFHLIKEKTA